MDLHFHQKFRDNTKILLRRCGYTMIRDFHSKKISFVRTLHSGAKYPRFHMYVLEDIPGRFSVNLHLDMSAAVYEGAKAHRGEYDSDIVKSEAQRISSMLQSNAVTTNTPKPAEQKKVGFWSRL